MDIDVIKSGITGDIGRELFYYDVVGSTNAVALEIAGGAAEGSVIISDGQTRGRGRLGRSWVSPPGVNIYLSILLCPRIKPEQVTLITIMSAVACARAVKKTTGLAISVKWPNDLMVSERKLGGILSEIKISGNDIVHAVVGAGINVNMEAGDFPDEIRAIATSVKNETGRSVPREPIVSAILNETARWYKLLNAGRTGEVLSEWRHLTSTLGRKVLVTSEQETYSGLAEAVDEAGMLLVRLPTGAIKRISTGDLTVLK